MKRTLLLGLVVAALVAACSTPIYRPASSNQSFGYTEAALEEDRYRVTFRARDISTAFDFALFRAAELTKDKGYDWFKVVRGFSNEDDGDDGTTVIIDGHGPYSRRGFGFGIMMPVDDGWDEAVQTFEIVLGKGEMPDGDVYYDAAAIIEKIGPRAYPPEE